MKSLKVLLKQFMNGKKKPDINYKTEEINHGEITHEIIFCRKECQELNSNILYYISFDITNFDTYKEYIESEAILWFTINTKKTKDNILHILISFDYNDIFDNICNYNVLDNQDNIFIRFLISDIRKNIPLGDKLKKYYPYMTNELQEPVCKSNKLFKSINTDNNCNLEIIAMDNISNIDYMGILDIFTIEELLPLMELYIQSPDGVINILNPICIDSHNSIYMILLSNLISAHNRFKDSEYLDKLCNIMRKDNIYFGFNTREKGKDNYVNILDICKHTYINRYYLGDHSNDSYNPYDEVDEIIE